MSIPTIAKSYALNGLNVSTFHISGKNKTLTYTNNNTYAVYVLVTMHGGLGVQNNSITGWVNNQKHYNAGYAGCAITCKVGSSVIATCTGGRGNNKTLYQTQWYDSTCVDHRYILGIKDGCKRQRGWVQDSVRANDKAYSGEVKSFMLTLNPRETLSFVIDNQAGWEARASVCVMQ